MASGKKIGDFSFKLTTFLNTPGPAGDVLRQVTWEGPVTGFGTVFVTVTYTGGSRSGTFSNCSTAFMDNGEFAHSIGQGTYESTGQHKWRTNAFFQLSDGRRLSSEGEIDFAQRSWKGKVFEMN